MDLTSKKTIKELLQKYNIKPSKRLGQNFLIDKSVLRKIIETANLSPKDTILEIGPGLGILTIELAKQAKQVIAVEKDKRMCEILKEVLKDYKNVKIINQDILSYKLPASRQGGQATSYKLIANLPYYITSPVIRKFLEINPPAGKPPKETILMVQKEVAQRIVAKPLRMNLLAVAVQFYAKAKIVSYVRKKSFYPQPKVDSAIIKIVPQPIPKINTKKFFQLVKTGFSSKRKMLKNNLQLEESILKKIKINPKTRAENLSIQDWLKLYDEIYKK